MTKKEQAECNKFIDYVIEAWKKKGTITNKKKARELIDILMYLLTQYRLKCLLGTIIDLDDLMEKYSEKEDNG